MRNTAPVRHTIVKPSHSACLLPLLKVSMALCLFIQMIAPPTAKVSGYQDATTSSRLATPRYPPSAAIAGDVTHDGRDDEPDDDG